MSTTTTTPWSAACVWETHWVVVIVVAAVAAAVIATDVVTMCTR
jgi:hypothetical protein